MPDKLININDHISKADLELILEVNKKSIELQTEVSDQNEAINNKLTSLEKSVVDSNKLLTKIDKDNTDIKNDIFKLQVLFSTMIVSLIIQIIQLFRK